MAATSGEIVRAVAAFGCATALALPDEPLDEQLFATVLNRTVNERLVGMLAAAVGVGGFPVTDAQHMMVAETEERWALQALRIERLLLTVASVFDAEGLSFLVFKGSALARTAYPDPSQRVFADLDVLVPGVRFDEARGLLKRQLGAEQPIPELRPGFDPEFGKEAVLSVGQGDEIDLHRTFVTGPIGLTLPLEDLFDSGSTFKLAGLDLPTLDPVDAFLHTCINAAVGDFPPRACSLRDVVQLAPAVADRHEEVMARATQWRVGLALRRAIELAHSELAIEPAPLQHLGADYRAGFAERLGMRSYLTPARSYTRPAASLLAIEGLRPRFRYLRAVVSPQPEYLQSRGWDRRAHFRRAIQRLWVRR